MIKGLVLHPKVFIIHTQFSEQLAMVKDTIYIHHTQDYQSRVTLAY